MSSEAPTPPQGPSYHRLIQELHGLVEAGAEAEPASAADFGATRALFDEHLDVHGNPRAYPEFNDVHSTHYLRDASQPEGGPRFRLTTDLNGRTNSTNSLSGYPTLILRLQQGIKEGSETMKGKPGSWSMALALTLRGDSVTCDVAGGVNTDWGRRDHLPISATSYFPVSKDLLSWVNNQVGRPNSVVSAVTGKESRLSAFIFGQPKKQTRREEYEPPVVSRKAFDEGGFTFLKRALKTALADERGQVVIDSGELKLTFVHNPANRTFMDGIRGIEGDAPESLEAFRRVASQYVIEQGLAELATERRRRR